MRQYVTANIAYLLCLPIIAAGQIALRDASAQQAKAGIGSPLRFKDTNWFWNYIFSGLLVTEVLLLLAVFSGRIIIEYFYDYKVPPQHAAFIGAYFAACMIGQTAHVFAIRLRSLRLSHVVSRNLLVSEIFIQLMALFTMTYFGIATPYRVAVFATGTYCVAYLALNLYSSWTHTNRRRQIAD